MGRLSGTDPLTLIQKHLSRTWSKVCIWIQEISLNGGPSEMDRLTLKASKHKRTTSPCEAMFVKSPQERRETQPLRHLLRCGVAGVHATSEDSQTLAKVSRWTLQQPR